MATIGDRIKMKNNKKGGNPKNKENFNKNNNKKQKSFKGHDKSKNPVLEYCIPKETVETLNLKSNSAKIDNPNIFLNKCISKDAILKSANKKRYLEDTNNLYHSKSLKEMLSNLRIRQDNEIECLKNIGYYIESFEMKNDYRMVVGLGGAHVLETNMLLHHIYGIPYIPGSALKGLAKATAVEMIREKIEREGLTEKVIQKNENLLKKLFKKEMVKENGLNDIDGYIVITKLVSYILESDDKLNCCGNGILKDIEIYKKIFGTQKNKGRAIFFDAFPIGNINMKLDVMTPHFPDYYKEMESKNPRKPPTDNQLPNPVVFLVLSNQEFKFNIGVKLYDEDYDSDGTPTVDANKLLETTTKLLKYGLKELGIGAKTSIGYGYFNE